MELNDGYGPVINPHVSSFLQFSRVLKASRHLSFISSIDGSPLPDTFALFAVVNVPFVGITFFSIHFFCCLFVFFLISSVVYWVVPLCMLCFDLLSCRPGIASLSVRSAG